MMPPTQPERSFVYRVDAGNRVVFVTSEWESFAKENQAPQLTSEYVYGQPLFAFVADEETQHLYQMIIDRVRRDHRTIVIPFRCDAPAVRRFMELTVSPWTNGQVQLQGRIVLEKNREAVSLLDPSASRNDEFLVVCSWCKRVRVNGDWLEVEEAIGALGLFDEVVMPQITHGICADCAERVRRELDDAG